jgi:acyl-CoA thioesterase-1
MAQIMKTARFLWLSSIVGFVSIGAACRGHEPQSGQTVKDARPPASHVATTGADPKVILFLGDSLSAGYGVNPGQAFPALIQDRIDSLGWNFRVINAGLSGDTTAGGLRRLDWLLRHKIDVLVLELGANDGLRGISPDVTKSNLHAIIDRTRSKYPDVKILIAGMQLPPNLGRTYVSRFQAIFPELARKNHAVFIPSLLQGVGGVVNLNQPDRIHPTPEGHKILAENVWRVLKPVLESMS